MRKRTAKCYVESEGLKIQPITVSEDLVHGHTHGGVCPPSCWYQLLIWSIWAAMAKCYGLGDSNNRHLFLNARWAEMSKTKVRAYSVLGEVSLPDL